MTLVGESCALRLGRRVTSVESLITLQRSVGLSVPGWSGSLRRTTWKRKSARHLLQPGSHVDDSQCVTLKLVESGNFLRFQVDTGAQCNVVPLDLYKKATKDHSLAQVKPI